jgi:hypothetical protein
VYIFNNRLIGTRLTTHIVSFVCFVFAKILVKEVYHFSQIVMGRAERKLGKLVTGSPEDLRFRGFFGVSAEVAVEAWEMMDKQKCLPPIPSSFTICGHLHLCKLTPQTMKRCQDHWGGVTPKQFTSTSGSTLIQFLSWMAFW